jgi:hypothetical protein
MPGRIDDYESATRRCKVCVSSVDRNALLTFVLESIEKKREIQIVTSRTETRGIPSKGGEPILWY